MSSLENVSLQNFIKFLPSLEIVGEPKSLKSPVEKDTWSPASLEMVS